MENNEKRMCGIVRPIAAMDGYNADHWEDVHRIVCEALETVDFTGRVVSTSDNATVIQGSIVKNLYEDPIVVCDVSGRNANVMFELGMRLAFNKPVVIIKDNVTPFSFDTSPIEHVGYPVDLRYQSMVVFKEELARKVLATADAPSKDGYASFLSHFGQFVSASIEKKEVSAQEFALNELAELKLMMRDMSRMVAKQHRASPASSLLEAAAAEYKSDLNAVKMASILGDKVSPLAEYKSAADALVGKSRTIKP